MTTRLARDPLYRGYRFPEEIISHCVWLDDRFLLSYRDVEELLAERGVAVSYETIRQWCRTFGPVFAARPRRRRARPGDTWHVDEMALKRNGKRHWLWRAVGQTGIVLDILVQPRRNGVTRRRPRPSCDGWSADAATNRGSSSRTRWPATHPRCAACCSGRSTAGTNA